MIIQQHVVAEADIGRDEANRVNTRVNMMLSKLWLKQLDENVRNQLRLPTMKDTTKAKGRERIEGTASGRAP